MFKQSFKYYKSKNSPPNYEDVLNFNHTATLLEKGLIKPFEHDLNGSSEQYGLRKPKTWICYEITSCKGLIFIKNPFTSAGQRYWVKQSLKEYTRKPNKLNIDSYDTVYSDKSWWDIAQADNKILLSLRWATLGYHHNWDTKMYSEDNKTQFPIDLRHMTEYIAQVMGYANFVAEAAIVNYYHLDSTLSGHTDHSEQNLEAPLFSFSFGQSAIFLLGGKTIDEPPTAMILQSGDVLIMSKESRLCYHGVPRIIRAECDVWNDDEELNFNNEYFLPKSINWKTFSNYLSNSRININVRQVLNIGQLKLNT